LIGKIHTNINYKTNKHKHKHNHNHIHLKKTGAWVVVDPLINPTQIEMYADQTSRGGVLEVKQKTTQT